MRPRHLDPTRPRTRRWVAVLATAGLLFGIVPAGAIAGSIARSAQAQGEVTPADEQSPAGTDAAPAQEAAIPGVSPEDEAATQATDATPEAAPNAPANTPADAPAPRTEGELPLLTLTKNVTVPADPMVPGDTFTYTIFVGCNQEFCQDVVIEDVLPNELTGFEIAGITVNHTGGGAAPAVAWDGGSERPTLVATDTTLTVTPQQKSGAATGNLTGMLVGHGVTITLTLGVPIDLPPTWEFNEQTITNTAEVDAANSLAVADSADVRVHVKQRIDVSVSKSWHPGTAQLQPGATSTIDLTVANASNVPVDSLTLQEPKAAADQAPTLDASNPFTLTDFAGFANFTAPAGMTEVTTWVYVWDNTVGEAGGYIWKTGPPATTPTLPAGVSTADVAGVRLVMTGEIDIAAAAEVGLDLTQRAENRNGGAVAAGNRVDNVAAGTAAKDDLDPVTKDATAHHSITAVPIGAAITKDINPKNVLAGQSSAATLTARPTHTDVTTMVISDRDYFVANEITFGGFTAAPTAPSTTAGAALAGSVTFVGFDGQEQTVEFAPGDTPALPSGWHAQDVAGFDLTWTATSGSITSAQAARVDFAIATSFDSAAPGQERRTTNTAGVTVTAPAGSASDSDTSTLRITTPSLTVGLAKSIRPGASTPVFAGDIVAVELTPTIQGEGSGMVTTELTVTDTLAMGEAEANKGFWNAFDLYAIAPTTVHAGTTLTVQIQVDGQWRQLDPFQGPDAFALSHDDLAQAAGGNTAAITGVEFTFTNGLGLGAITAPNLNFQARDELRDGSGPTAPAGQRVTYRNHAATQGTGHPNVPGAPEQTDQAQAQADAAIQRPGENGAGPCTGSCEGAAYGVNKQWVPGSSLLALSEATSATRLQWRLGGSFDSAVLQDHGAIASNTPAEIAKTVYDAFNLTGIRQINDSATPGSNGWYLRWDKVTAIEIFDGTTWRTPTNASATDGNFARVTTTQAGVPTQAWLPAVALTSEEQGSTLALRLTLEPNDAARAAAIAAGQPAPAPGSGVARSAAMREFILDWQLRDTLRSDSTTFVTAETLVNTTIPGLVNNTVQLTPHGAEPATAGANIAIVKATPNVAVTKSVTPASIQLPVADGAGHVTFTSIARNTGQGPVAYLRLADPEPCADTAASCAWSGDADVASQNPYDGDMPDGGWLAPSGGSASAFDSFTMTKVSLAPDAAGRSEVDLTKSTAWLLHYNGSGAVADRASYSTTSLTVAELNELGADKLTDVVGVALTLQAADPTAGGGTITNRSSFTLAIEADLRSHRRSSPAEAITLAPNATAEVTNTVFVQGWDPVQNAGAQIFDKSNATVRLFGPKIEVTPGKTIEPASIRQVERDTPVRVTLSGTSADSTMTPTSIWLQDDRSTSPDFWSTFELTGIDSITAPAGAEQVQVDLLVPDSAGTDDWIEGTPSPVADPVLPDLDAATLADVRGIRLTFTAANGEAMTASWSTAVVLTAAVRADYVFPATGSETVTNRMSIQNVTDPDDPAANSPVATADAAISLAAGSHTLAVNKLATSEDFPTRFAEVGLARPWTLTFTNTGTGLLTITELRDFLGDTEADGTRNPESSFLTPGSPTNTTFATSEGGTLATAGITESYLPETDELVWTWPEGGRTMQPGETFTITVDMVLEPGLATGGTAFNSMEVVTEQTLASCTNLSQHQQETMGTFGSETSCGTRDFVQPAASLNLWTQKAVMGSVGTAAVDGTRCEASVTGYDGKTYFPSPCLADTRYSVDQNVQDRWLLRTSNTTTEPVTELIVFDDVPNVADKLLIGGAARGSDYRTVLAGEPSLHTSNGTKITDKTIEVTTTPDACQGTWTYLNANPGAVPCDQNGATWTAVDEGTDWSVVTGLRIHLVFDPEHPLAMGETLDIGYRTYNVIETNDGATHLSRDVPVPHQEAWNQFGVQWRFAGGEVSQRIPDVVGVTPVAGPLQIVKVVDGPAAAFAPDSVTFQVQCSITQPGSPQRVDLALAEGGVVTVTKGEDGSYAPARIDGIPLGADCWITETNDGGATEHTVEPGQITISEPADAEGNVPAAQVVTVTNTFDVAALAVTKQVTGAGADYGTGPFTLQAQCTFQGEPVELADGGTITLPTADGGWTATIGNIPVGADCSVTETVAGGATTTTIVPESVVITQPGQNESIAAITVTNDFQLGGLMITKELAGAGAESYGTGPFTFQTQCTFEGKPVDLGGNATVSLPTEGAWHTTIPGIPVGADCTVAETGSGAATGSALYPNDGAVTIPAPGAGEQPVLALVSATNTFDTGALQVAKTVAGSGATEYGTGPFTFQTECSYQVQGQPVSISLPGDGALTLPTADGSWSHTYGDLIVGAECVTVETGDGGASLSAMSPADGSVTIPPLRDGVAQTVAVAVTNTFEVGHIGVEKVVTGPFDLDSAELADLTFTVAWAADNGESGTLELTADTDWQAISKDLPIGTAVTLTEVDLPELAPHVGFTGFRWLEQEGVTVSADGTEATVVVGAEPVRLQVDNAFELLTGTFQVSKLLTGDFAATSPEMRDRTFTVTWTAGERTGSIELNAANGWTGGPEAVFPVGSTVELAEAAVTGLPPHVQFDHATWTEVPGLVINEDGTATLTVGAGDAAEVELSNHFTLLTGTFGVAKVITGDFEQDAPEFDQVTFLVDYTVSTGESGQLELNRAGEWSAEAGEFPTGATVTLTEAVVDQGDLAPHVLWNGYTWAAGEGYQVSQDGLTATVVVGDGTRVGLELANRFTELLGSFGVQKVVAGDFDLTDPELSDLVFAVDYTASTGQSGTLELSAENGWSAAPEGTFRTGSTVELTEVTPTGMGPSVHWEGYTWLAQDGITLSEDGGTATITVGNEEPVRLQVENTFTELTGTFGVEKLVEGDFVLTDPELWGQTFVVSYQAVQEVTGATWSGELALDADGDWKAELGQQLPAGTMVTLTEVEVTDLAPNVAWDGYTWRATEGVEVSEDGRTATFVVGEDSQHQLQVVNTFTELLGGFTLTKQVTGEGANRVPGNFEFVAEYSLDGGESWIPLPSATKDAPLVAGPSDIPLGTEVLIREVTPGELVDVAWGSPAFSGTGVTPGADGQDASFVIASTDTPVAVLLTNPTTPLNGQFQVTKQITGDGTALLAGDPLFTLTYTQDGGEPTELTVTAGQVVSSAPIPAGTEVTITEVTPRDGLVAGASWGTPVFVLSDGTVVANGSTFTIEADTVLALTLENPTVAPLPSTGVDPVRGVLVIGGLLVAGGLALALRRRGEA